MHHKTQIKQQVRQNSKQHLNLYGKQKNKSKIIKPLGTIMLLVLSLTSTQSFGWGDTGHQAIGLIAQDNLSPKAKQQISVILNGEGLDTASVWADRVKNGDAFVHTKPYHFVNVPENMNYLSSISNMPVEKIQLGDIVRAILVAENTLKNPKADAYSKANAIRFFVHFVGDLHQPLHAGYVHDRGGNSVTMKWFSDSTNLHAVIDSFVIRTFTERTMQIYGGKKPGDFASPGQAYYQSLPTPPAQEIAKWQNSFLSDWVEESVGNRQGLYNGIQGSTETYFKNNVGLVNYRVLQAGYRTAAWLNSVYEGQNFQAPKNQQFRQNINQALQHQLEEGVVLNPKNNGPKTIQYMNRFNCNHKHPVSDQKLFW